VYAHLLRHDNKNVFFSKKIYYIFLPVRMHRIRDTNICIELVMYKNDSQQSVWCFFRIHFSRQEDNVRLLFKDNVLFGFFLA